MISIDIETYSSEDIKNGVYKYVSSPDFEILLIGYSIDNGEVKLIDIVNGDEVPPEFVKALSNPEIIKSAFNANFERVCLSKHFNTYFKPKGWNCSKVHSTILGLPASLDKVGEVLKLEDGKIKEGKELIRYFCKPCRPTKVNGGRTRNLPEHDPDKWDSFKTYCIRDVEVEMDITSKLSKFPIIKTEVELYELDQLINDRGIKVDMELVNNAIECDSLNRQDTEDKLIELTKVDNPNSLMQLKAWFAEQGLTIESLDKKAISDLLKTNLKDNIKQVLKYRQELGKTSVKKYEAMKSTVGKNDRIRGVLQYYGAGRTGRWAGRLVQIQNLPQGKLEELEGPRAQLKTKQFAKLKQHGTTSNVLSGLIRTAFIPEPGKKFIVADFSAIEARVLAWIAGESWRLDVFNTHGKIYEASASKMFDVPIEEITKESPLRQKGKIAELALGYQGGTGALISMGALEKGLTEEELKQIVKDWRVANPSITSFWEGVNKAAMSCIKEKIETEFRQITFNFNSNILFLTLPSGRSLAYTMPRIEKNRYGTQSIVFKGVGMTKKWEDIPTYGGKLTENIVQAIARDLLAESMLKLDKLGYKIIAHVHDEVIIEAEDDKKLEDVCRIMCELPTWASGLPMNADGFEGYYYKK
jgi:DNA polymerase